MVGETWVVREVAGPAFVVQLRAADGAFIRNATGKNGGGRGYGKSMVARFKTSGAAQRRADKLNKQYASATGANGGG